VAETIQRAYIYIYIYVCVCGGVVPNRLSYHLEMLKSSFEKVIFHNHFLILRFTWSKWAIKRNIKKQYLIESLGRKSLDICSTKVLHLMTTQDTWSLAGQSSFERRLVCKVPFERDSAITFYFAFLERQLRP